MEHGAISAINLTTIGSNIGCSGTKTSNVDTLCDAIAQAHLA